MFFLQGGFPTVILLCLPTSVSSGSLINALFSAFFQIINSAFEQDNTIKSPQGTPSAAPPHQIQHTDAHCALPAAF